MIAYEKLHEKLKHGNKMLSVCWFGCDDIDFSNPDSLRYGFLKWNNGNQGQYQKIPQIIYMDDTGKQNKFIVYREYMNWDQCRKIKKPI